MYRPQWHTLGHKTSQAKWHFFGIQKNDATRVEKNFTLSFVKLVTTISKTRTATTTTVIATTSDHSAKAAPYR